jgi:hypothetical protein
MRQGAGFDVNGIFQGVGQPWAAVECEAVDTLASSARIVQRVSGRHRSGPPDRLRGPRVVRGTNGADAGRRTRRGPTWANRRRIGPPAASSRRHPDCKALRSRPSLVPKIARRLPGRDAFPAATGAAARLPQPPP